MASFRWLSHQEIVSHAEDGKSDRLLENTDAARRAIKVIRSEVKILAHQPNVGRAVDDLEPEHKDWLIDFGVSGYIARYRIDGDTITMLAIRHQKEAGF